MSADLSAEPGTLTDEELIDRVERALVGAAVAIGACVIASAQLREYEVRTDHGRQLIISNSVQLVAELMGAIQNFRPKE